MNKPHPKVKRIKLDALSKIQPKYRGAVGTYVTETDTIYIDADLPEVTNGTKGAAIQHEIGHRLVHKGGIKFQSESDEEMFVLWWELFTTAHKHITHTEALVRDDMLGGLKWSNMEDRRAIAAAICQRMRGKLPADLFLKALADQGFIKKAAKK